jgi:hypothetical protein
MRKLAIGALTTIAIAIFHSVVVASILPKDTAARIEAIPVQTLTISDQQFLTGDRSGRPTTIAGALRIARGSGRLPLVILMHGSGGFEANTDLWRRQFGAYPHLHSIHLPDGESPALSLISHNSDD